MADVELDVSKMKTLLKFLQGGMPSIKVGIMGQKNKRTARKGDSPSNAEIGFTNEFGKMTGYPKIPARSFIRMPLNTHFYDKMLSKKSLTVEEFEKAIKSGNAEEFAKKVGIVAEETIQDAFATRGWGEWEPNADLTVKLKGSDSPLIDTGQLRRSITSKVIKENE